jgi:predicted GIY-YIG superfamily endonuclease
MSSNAPYYVYILRNRHRTVLYIGMTNDLQRRMRQHAEATSGFTARYNVTDLVYVERYGTSTAAIEREKQLKAWRREKKEALIRRRNPEMASLPVPVE